MGKTTILRSYLEGTDPEKTRIVYIFNAALSFQKLLKQIFLELGIPISDEEPSELVNSLHHYLIEEYKNDRNVVLIIDEAQNMPVETLEHIRMLSNLETSQDKLIQIILVGQPEFDSILNLPELRRLKQRIAIRCRIDPLSSDESLAYIQHRLTRASAFHNPVFTKGALKEIVKEAKGIPRTINVIADNALITAFGYQQNPVDSKIIKEVIADLQGHKPAVSLRWRTAVAVSLMVIIALLLFFFRDSLIPDKISPVAAVPHARTESVDPAEPERSAEPKQEVIEQKALEKSAPTSDTDQSAPSGASDHRRGGSWSGHQENSEKTKIQQDQQERRSSSPSSPDLETAIPVKPVNPVIDASRSFSPRPQTNVSETYIEPEKIPAVAESVQIVQKPGSRVRIVKRGDSVFRLLFDVYGRFDEPLVKSFKDLNPQIRDLNRVKIGDEVLLPGVEDSLPASN